MGFKKKTQAVVDETKYEEADAVEDMQEEDEVPTTAANVAELEAQMAFVLRHSLDNWLCVLF